MAVSRTRLLSLLAVALSAICLAAAALPTKPAPPRARADGVRFDFETGDLQGWRVVEGAFGKLVTDPRDVRDSEGKFLLTTLQREVEAGKTDGFTGAIESPVFTLAGPEITFRVGGGSHPDTYVAICTLDGKEQAQARGISSVVMQPVQWQLPALVGKQVFLRIVDHNGGGWGHVTFDDFTAQGAIDALATRRHFALALAHSLPTAPLRAAIQDLAATFGRQYPRGAEYLKRLDGIAQAAADDPDALEAQAAQLRSLRREALLANPLLTRQPILFVARPQYLPDHHNTETMFITGEINTGSYRGGGALKALDVATGKVRTIVDAGATGIARDPDVRFDGKRVLFSMRRSITDDYHLYEVGADGSGLKQLTRLPQVADIDPVYLPCGDIVFSSTREPKYCGCNRHPMANIYRMEADGANIHRIGGSTLFEGHNRVMPDGRIVYYRWEYIDRDFGDAQGLWTVNPDGTNHAVYWGNNKPSPGAILDPRPIPGTGLVVCTFSSCHDRPWGALAILDRSLGIDATEQDKGSVVLTWPRSARDHVGRGWFDEFSAIRPRYEDPCPLSGKYFLCAREVDEADWRGPGPRPEMGIYLVDLFGNEVLVHAEAPGCFNPQPLAARPRQPVIPTRRTFDDQLATVYVQDVYQGTHMKGVERGEAKFIRVVESPEKRHWSNQAWNGQGQQAPAMNWHNFENKRILGTAPIEADGSAYFRVPPDTYVYFQLLDRDRRMIHSMRSGVVFQPGEKVSCIGCHESRLASPVAKPTSSPAALRRAASTLETWNGAPRLISYVAEVQPVWDKHCVSCHDFGKPAGKVLNLAGDRDLFFNASYEALHQRWNQADGWLKTVGAGPPEIQQANSWGSRASRLVQFLGKEHYGVTLPPDDLNRVITWIDLNAPYYPNYATPYPDNLAGRSPLNGAEVGRLQELTGVDLAGQADWSRCRGPLLSFDRPELSPCLAGAGAPGTPRYQEALAIIRTGLQRLIERPRGDVDGYTSCPVDEARENRYRERRSLEQRNRAAIREGRKVYDP